MNLYRIKIRDWDINFEADRSRQWKNIKWVPIPNKQGLGYKKVMAQKNGATIFGCWIALVEQGSLCDPRGDLSKYTIEELSIKTLIPLTILTESIDYILQNLDWIEVVENHDKNVKECQKYCSTPPRTNSMLCHVMSCSSSSTEKDSSLVTSTRIITTKTFELFWEAYPKKVGKKAAEKVWLKIKSPSETLEKILTALSWQKKCEQWSKEDGQFIPYPSTYLNQGRWMDEPPASVINQQIDDNFENWKEEYLKEDAEEKRKKEEEWKKKKESKQ